MLNVVQKDETQYLLSSVSKSYRVKECVWSYSKNAVDSLRKFFGETPHAWAISCAGFSEGHRTGNLRSLSARQAYRATWLAVSWVLCSQADCIQPLEQVDLGFSFIYRKKSKCMLWSSCWRQSWVFLRYWVSSGLWKIETLFLTEVRGTGDANCYSNCGEQASLSASGDTDHRCSQGDTAGAGGIEGLVSWRNFPDVSEMFFCVPVHRGGGGGCLLPRCPEGFFGSRARQRMPYLPPEME